MLAILTIIPLEVSMRKSYWYFWGLVILLLGMGNVGQAQDSLGMRCVSRLNYWGTVNGIQMVGDIAYIVSGNAFYIVSLADPANPVEVGQANWSDYWGGMSVCVVGNLAYVNPGYGVIVYDVSDPAHLVTLADWQPWPECEVEDFLPLGDIAIMKIIDGDLCLVDISDLGNIHIIEGSFPPEPSSPTWAGGLVGEYLCLRGWGLSIWDISDPSLPVQVAVVDSQYWFWGGATISRNYIYAGTYENGLRIIDASNPLQPFEVSTCDSGWCVALTVTGEHAIVYCSNGLDIWNVAAPTQPVFEGSFGSQISFSFCLASSGNLVGAGDMRSQEPSLLVVNITNPQTPTEAGTFGTKGSLNRMAVSGTVGYLAGGYSTLRTIDLSNPTQVVELATSHQESPFGSFDIAIRGSYAYMACGSGGLMVYDVSNPSYPDSVACLQEIISMERVTIAGDYAYAIDGYSGSPFRLRTFSLENPAVPVSVDTLLITNYASGDFGFVATNEYLYLGRDNGFYVYSLINPATPQLVGSCGLPSGEGFYVNDLSVLDHYVYVAYVNGGMRIVDVSNPTHPALVGSVAEPTWAVTSIGNTLVTFMTGGFSIKDITNRINPVTIGYYYYQNAADECARDMDILGQYLVAISKKNFRVFQCDVLSVTPSPPEVFPSEFKLYPCFPNPFNPNTVIRFSLPFTELVKLTIYDVTGRQVEILTNQVFSVGEHRLTFMGSNLSSGVYFIRLEAGNHMQTEKLVLLK
jgi:hypothetical protein